MLSSFTLGLMPHESLLLFNAHAFELIETSSGRQQLLEGAKLFSARLVYQKSKIDWVKEWVTMLEWMNQHLKSGTVAEDTHERFTFRVQIGLLLEQMRGLLIYQELYSVESILGRPLFKQIIQGFGSHGDMSVEQIRRLTSLSHQMTNGMLNGLLDARLLEYGEEGRFRLSADGRQVYEVL